MSPRKAVFDIKPAKLLSNWMMTLLKLHEPSSLICTTGRMISTRLGCFEGKKLGDICNTASILQHTVRT